MEPNEGRAPNVPSGVGVLSPANQNIWGSVVKSPAGPETIQYAFLRILKATERSFLHPGLYDKALSSSNSVLCHINCGGEAEIWGQLPPAPM